MPPLGTRSRGGASRSRSRRSPKSSSDSGSIAGSRVCAHDRPLAVERPGPPRARRSADAAAAAPPLRPRPRSQGLRQQRCGRLGAGRHRPLAEDQPVVPVARDGTHRARAASNRWTDLGRSASATRARPGSPRARAPRSRARTRRPRRRARPAARRRARRSRGRAPPRAGGEHEPRRPGLAAARHAVREAREERPPQRLVSSVPAAGVAARRPAQLARGLPHRPGRSPSRSSRARHVGVRRREPPLEAIARHAPRAPRTPRRRAARRPPTSTRARRGCRGSRSHRSPPSAVSRPPSHAPSRSSSSSAARSALGRGRLEPLERARVAAPGEHVERGPGEVDALDLRLAVRAQAVARVPEAQHAAGPGAAGPARALLRRVQRDPLPLRGGRGRAPRRSAGPCASRCPPPSRPRRPSATSPRCSWPGSPCGAGSGRAPASWLVASRVPWSGRTRSAAPASAPWTSRGSPQRPAGSRGRGRRGPPRPRAPRPRAARPRRVTDLHRVGRARPPRAPGSRRGNAATGPASSVADITTTRRSSRAARACFRKASARSAWRLRSWNSSSDDGAKAGEQRVRVQPRVQDPLGGHEQPRVLGELALEADLPAHLAAHHRSPAPRRCARASERAATRRGWSRITGPSATRAGARASSCPRPEVPRSRARERGPRCSADPRQVGVDGQRRPA